MRSPGLHSWLIILPTLFLPACGDYGDIAESTQAVLIVDLVGDGLCELALASRRYTDYGGYGYYGYHDRIYRDDEKGGRATLFFQDEEGQLRKSGRYRLLRYPVAIAATDIDGSGRPDLVLAHYEYDRNMSLLLQDPEAPGRFLPPIFFATSFFPTDLTAGDFDQDGRPDLATASERFGLALVMQAPGAPTRFLPERVIAESAVSVAAGDLDGDGLADIAYIADGIVSILWQDPLLPGEFTDRLDLDAGVDPVLVRAGDLNGDALLDLAVANFAEEDALRGEGVTILFQDPTNPGSFLFPRSLETGSGTWWVSISDIDSDGHGDLVAASRTPDVVVLFQERGRPGEFEPPLGLPVRRRPFSVVAGDVNGDGAVDLAVVPLSERKWVEIIPQNPEAPRTFGESYRLKY